MKPLVLYHAGCFDGHCAAWVAHHFLGDIEAVPVQYGNPPPDVEGRDVHILDFSYDFETLEGMAGKADTICILDHHKSREQDLKKFNELAFMRNERSLLHAHFDNDKSGGRLAWDYFAPKSLPASWLVDYTEDRDLWRWKLWKSKEINAALRSYPMDFDLWDSFDKLTVGRSYPYREGLLTGLEGLAMEGTAILRREQQIVADHVRFAREIEIGAVKVLSVNATVCISEIGQELAKGRPFSAVWFQRADGKKVWSLRSDESGMDVSEIAKRHGGGGHRRAAGYEE